MDDSGEKQQWTTEETLLEHACQISPHGLSTDMPGMLVAHQQICQVCSWPINRHARYAGYTPP